MASLARSFGRSMSVSLSLALILFGLSLNGKHQMDGSAVLGWWWWWWSWCGNNQTMSACFSVLVNRIVVADARISSNELNCHFYCQVRIAQFNYHSQCYYIERQSNGSFSFSRLLSLSASKQRALRNANVTAAGQLNKNCSPSILAMLEVSRANRQALTFLRLLLSFPPFSNISI